MKQGDTITVDTTGVNSEGDGIARYGDEGFVVFITGALPGETVRARVDRVTKRWAGATALEVIEPADVRRAPSCRHFGRCGGCQLQHATYGAQTAIKSRTLADALRRALGTDAPRVIDCAPSPHEWGYRNKTAMPIHAAPRGKGIIAGYFERGSHRIVRYGECPVLAPELQRAVPKFLDALARSGLDGYDERSHKGTLRYAAARVGGDGRVLLCAVVARELAKREIGRLRDICQRLAADDGAIAGAVVNVNTDPGNFIWGPVFRALTGAKFAEQRLGPFTYATDISSFFQVNSAQAEAMFTHVEQQLAASRAERVLELYSGVGGLTAFIARTAHAVTAVEEWRPAARLLSSNMEANGIANVTAVESSAERFLSSDETTRDGDFDAIVLDPPRTGIPAEAAEAIRRARPATIVYVSCAPSTLARDIARLTADDAYRMTSIRAFDMFPQTAHVESVAVLSRADICFTEN